VTVLNKGARLCMLSHALTAMTSMLKLAGIAMRIEKHTSEPDSSASCCCVPPCCLIQHIFEVLAVLALKSS
jgi:hypothetical protein